MERVPSLVRHAQIDSPEPPLDIQSVWYLLLGKLLLKLDHWGKGDQRGPALLGGSRGVSIWALPSDPNPICPQRSRLPLLLLAQVFRKLDLFELVPVSTPSCRRRLARASSPLSPGSALPPLTHTASFPSLLHTLPWDKRQLQA